MLVWLGVLPPPHPPGGVGVFCDLWRCGLNIELPWGGAPPPCGRKGEEVLQSGCFEFWGGLRPPLESGTRTNTPGNGTVV